MVKTGMVQIHFILDNELFACRYVYHPPRAGDEARFNDNPYKVTRVCWAYDEEDCQHERMNCEIVKAD